MKKKGKIGGSQLKDWAVNDNYYSNKVRVEYTTNDMILWDFIIAKREKNALPGLNFGACPVTLGK